MIKYLNNHFPNLRNQRQISFVYTGLKHISQNNNLNNKNTNSKVEKADILDYLVINKNEMLENKSKKESKKFVYISQISQMKYSIAGAFATCILIYHGN